MKAARRIFLDEIVGNVIVDFVATKKAQKQQKNEHPTENVRAYTLDGEKVNVSERRDSASCTASGACFDASGSTNSAKKYFQDLSMDVKMKSVGGFENLRTANIAISRVLFSYCMEVLWNDVFYDPVANYTLTWRNSRRLSQSSIGNETTEREPVLPVEEFDFPPGFQPRVEESLVCGSFSKSQSIFSEDKSSKPGSMVRAPMLKVEYTEIIEAVEKKLFLAAKESSDVFLIAALEEEVYALVKDLKDDVLKEVCNETDPATSGERTGSEMVQGLDSEGNGVDVSQTPMEGTESSNQADVSFHKHSLCGFLENGFKRLGTPATPVIDDQTIDEPDPPGLYCLNKIMPIQHLQMCLVGRSETPHQGLGSSHQTAASVYGKVSDFLGSAFKRLGTPTCGEVNVQRTDEPPPPGYENHIDKVVQSSNRKIRQLGPSEGIPKWRKFVLLALFRQKLHDDVLSEWKSSFDDDVGFKFLVSWCNLKQCKAGQVKHASESGGLLELSSVMEPALDDLLERSKSCHSSGPSEVSVDMFTYSRKKKARKNSGDDPESPTLVDMILRRQSFKNFGKQKSSRDESGSGASGVVNVKHKIYGTSWKPIESAVGTSKVGGSVKEKLNKDRLTIRTLVTKKSPRMAGSSQDKVLVSSVKPGMSMVSGREVISKDTEELSSTKICDVVSEDKFAADQSQKLPKSSKKMKLKREHVVDDSLPLLSKVPRLIDSYVKKTAGKKVAKSRILTSKLRLLSSCPISDGCARSSINGWEWRNWSLTARPAERARVRGIQITSVQRFSAEIIVSQSSHVKGISARTNRVKMRNLLAAAEGAELLKASQLNARKKRLRFQQSKIHDWGLVALEPIEADDFVIEYVGELIRPRISDIRELQYEKMGIGSSYLFRLDDGYVVDATKRGGVARFINHSCEPNCYTKIVSVEGQKRIFIYAKRHVAAGEEITYNYKFPLEEKKIPCNCGSKRCRGSMN